MKNLINKTVAAVSILLILLVSFPLQKTYAVGDAQPDVLEFCSDPDFKDSDICTQKSSDPNGDKIGGTNGLFVAIIDLIIYLTASISILMIIIGAFKYVTSGGDPSQTKSAKDTILFSLVGLFIAVSSFAVVRFIVSKI